MEMKRLLLNTFTVGLLLIILSSSLLAQEKHFILTDTKIIPMKSELTGRDHELIIFLPASYADSTDKHYPVLYFMDAYWDTPLLYSIHGQLVWDRVLPELIMVGFSYPGGNPDYGELRSRDLTPTKVAAEPGTGDGPEFLKFIEETVIPYIESNYRADKDERAISGSSLGGLFTLYAMYEKPALFKRFISVSPAVMWDNAYLFRRDSLYAEKNESLAARLFLSHGGDEYYKFRNPIIAFQKQIEERNYRNFALLNYTIEGERHSGVKSEGYSRGLIWVFKDIAPGGPGGLERNYYHGD